MNRGRIVMVCLCVLRVKVCGDMIILLVGFEGEQMEECDDIVCVY